MTAERHPLSLRVQEATFLAEQVIGLTLVDPQGRALPAWTPGSHIDIVLPSGAIRSYSLCGEIDRAAYRIAVLNEANGRGGSREIHARQLVGALLRASPPRNHFELVDAPHYVFIAGGIGITPLLPMARAVAARGGSWEMHYLGRSRARMSHLDVLMALAGDRLRVVARDERERTAMRDILAAAPPRSAVYCCGPEGLLNEVEALCAASASGLDLRVERFGRPTLAAPDEMPPMPATPEALAPCDPDGPFQVELRRSGVVVDVAAGESILERARKVRTGLSFSCSDGYCGTCETPVIAGVPDHRDTVLTDDEKARNATMMICVGRSRTRRLVLDL
jgi:ferredoxin-NADP reductase